MENSGFRFAERGAEAPGANAESCAGKTGKAVDGKSERPPPFTKPPKADIITEI